MSIDRVHASFDLNGYAGTYRPTLLVFREGRNGSPAGFGPKGWPRVLTGGRWNSCLRITLPHLSWARAWKLRRVGGLRVYRWIYRLYA